MQALPAETQATPSHLTPSELTPLRDTYLSHVYYAYIHLHGFSVSLPAEDETAETIRTILHALDKATAAQTFVSNAMIDMSEAVAEAQFWEGKVRGKEDEIAELEGEIKRFENVAEGANIEVDRLDGEVGRFGAEGQRSKEVKRDRDRWANLEECEEGNEVEREMKSGKGRRKKVRREQ
jgi:hypothetical protein